MARNKGSHERLVGLVESLVIWNVAMHRKAFERPASAKGRFAKDLKLKDLRPWDYWTWTLDKPFWKVGVDNWFPDGLIDSTVRRRSQLNTLKGRGTTEFWVKNKVQDFGVEDSIRFEHSEDIFINSMETEEVLSEWIALIGGKLSSIEIKLLRAQRHDIPKKMAISKFL